MKKYYLAIVALILILIALTATFIFDNSVQSGEESRENSDKIASWIRPILDPNNTMSDEDFNRLVRKTAHFIEFGVLGVGLGILAEYLRKRHNRKFVAMPLFVALAVAVTDEFIQSFAGRSSMISDVLIDFGGAVAGMIFAFLAFCLISVIMQSGKNKKV